MAAKRSNKIQDIPRPASQPAASSRILFMHNWTKGRISQRPRKCADDGFTKRNNRTALFTSPMIYAHGAIRMFFLRFRMQSGTCDPVSSWLSTQRSLGYCRLAYPRRHRASLVPRRECAKLSNTLSARIAPLNVSVYARSSWNFQFSNFNIGLIVTARSRCSKYSRRSISGRADDQASREC